MKENNEKVGSQEIIERVTVDHLRVPLKQPYHLAYGTLEFFPIFLIRVDTPAGIGFGETVPLPGYGWENEKSVEKALSAVAPQLIGLITGAASALVEKQLTGSPFAAGAFLPALEKIDPLPSDRGCLIPLAGLIEGTTLAEVARQVKDLLNLGFRELKIKVGISDSDLERVCVASGAAGANSSLRIDANQSWDLEKTLNFMEEISGLKNIIYLEQPLPRGDWAGYRRLKEEGSYPVMLDESIYSEDDLTRAIDEGCAGFVKLKLAKTGSPRKMLSLAARAAAGLEVIIGNGVAGEIGCWQEVLLYRLIYPEGDGPAGEMNGFLKPTESILCNPLSFSKGMIVYPASYQPIVDDKQVTKFLRERIVF